MTLVHRWQEALSAAQRAAQLAPDEPDVEQTLASARRRAEAAGVRPQKEEDRMR
jgi:hypothetical protein